MFQECISILMILAKTFSKKKTTHFRNMFALVSKPNYLPDKRYLVLGEFARSVVRKRCHSKAYHDELSRATKCGFSIGRAKVSARKVSLNVIETWEKDVV
jgi:hypothetical protein